MKLLVLAQIPPPLHGQSVMVQTLVEGLPALGVPLHHVNLRLSRDAADIGRWRPGKVFAVLSACVSAIVARFRHQCDTLYYVPAPGKRGALYRDWIVMLFCRPFFRRLVLHFHNGGLADWLATEASSIERGLSRALLGRSDLSIVLAESLRPDAAALNPRRIAVVANGIADPCPDWVPRSKTEDEPYQVLFLGLCSEEKGLFDAAQAVLAANRAVRAPRDKPRFRLVAAGPFSDYSTGSIFEDLCREHTADLRYLGPVQGAAKADLFRTSHCLCLPTRYPHEAQPLVLLEAIACDLPVVATRWRGIPNTLPACCAQAEPGNVTSLVAVLRQTASQPPARGEMRNHFRQNFTTERHLALLAAALSLVAR